MDGIKTRDKGNLVFVFKQKKSLRYFIAYTLMMLLFALWVQYILFGGALFVLSVFVFITLKDGIELDLNNWKYRNVKILGKQVWGTWKELPQIRYISVFRTVLKSSVMGISGAVVSNREKIYLINFVYGKNHRLKVYQTTDLEDAFSKAEYFSRKLNLKVYDATSGKGVWVNKKN